MKGRVREREAREMRDERKREECKERERGERKEKERERERERVRWASNTTLNPSRLQKFFSKAVPFAFTVLEGFSHTSRHRLKVFGGAVQIESGVAKSGRSVVVEETRFPHGPCLSIGQLGNRPEERERERERERQDKEEEEREALSKPVGKTAHLQNKTKREETFSYI